jgi:hypothetical protein
MKELTKRVPQNVLHQAILSSSMAEHSASKELLVVAQFFAALPQRKLGWLLLT